MSCLKHPHEEARCLGTAPSVADWTSSMPSTPVSRWMGEEGPLSGDFRDWDLIRGQAQDIVDELTGVQTPRRAS
jgi:hypothetical protein